MIIGGETKMTNYERDFAERMKDPEFKAAYDALESEYAVKKQSIIAQQARWKARANGHVHKPIKIKMRIPYGKKSRKQTHIVVKTIEKF